MKFKKDKEVTSSWFMVPSFYTGIIHPNNTNKELVLMEYFGKHWSACWRNNKTNKVGIYFIVKADKNGFTFKDKKYSYINCKIVW